MYLPSPPNEEEKYAYIHQDKWKILLFGGLSTLLLTIGFVLFSVQHPSLWVFLPFIMVLAFYLGISYLVGLKGESFSLIRHQLDILKAKYPSVDVYLPCCGEPIEVIRNTYEHVSKLQYPGHINFYVLDDKGDPSVETLANIYHFNYISRPNKGELKKAGNLRYAFERTNGDLIAVFDADFCPRSDFLIETVPYFRNEKIAVVQTPQFFSIEKGQTWVEKGAGYVQELFYRLIQVNRNSFGGSICVGTCAVYRRMALRPFGGTAPIAYSEDLHTGFMLSRAGWEIKYIPVVLAKGVCPDSLKGLFTQQYRWCMGSTTLFLNPEFWQTPMPIMRRSAYLSGMLYYWATALGVFLSPLPGVIMISFWPEKIFFYNYVFSIPSFLFSVVIVSLWSKHPFTFHQFRVRHAQNWAHLFAIADKLRGNLMPWIATGTAKGSNEYRYYLFCTLNMMWVTIITFLVIVGLISHMNSENFVHFIPIMFFTTWNFLHSLYNY